MRRGKVFLVGAGPGSADLLTLRAYTILQRADVVFYDRLVGKGVLRFIPKGSRKVYVGKGPKGQVLTQEDINGMLVEEALKGEKVVRLKGGDPFLFGRGGEEAEALVEKGVSVEVVPGVTSALAAPAYAGIPLTDRRYSSSVAIVTGQEEEGGGGGRASGRIRWEAIASAVDTVVVLMGVGNIEKISEELLKGLGPEKDVAIIESATVKRQRTIIGKLGRLSEVARERGVRSPSVIVVGDVVKMGRKLGWFRDPVC